MRDPRHHRAHSLALALLLAGALAGCGSSDKRTLYSVGDRTMTVGDFEELARGNEASFLGDADQAKTQLLDDLMRRDLLLRAAEERGLYRDTVTIRFREAASKRILTQTLFDRLTPKNIGVSDAEVEQMIAWQDSVSHLLVIYTQRRDAADAALASLRAGADFREVADRFNSTGILPPGGDLGPIMPGQLVAPLDEQARTAPLRQVVGPLDAPGEGWFLLMVVDRQYRPLPRDETRAPVVRELLRQRKRGITMQRAISDLRSTYHFALVPGGAQAMHAHYNANPLGQQLEGMGESLEPPPAADALAQELATWTTPAGERQRYTLGEALDDIQNGVTEAPPTSMIGAIEDWIGQQALQRIAALEARRRQIDKEPGIRRQIDRGVDNLVLDSIYKSDVLPLAATGDAMVEAWYASAQQEFAELARVDLRTATFADSARANAFLRHGGHAENFEAALAMVNETLPITDRSIAFPNTETPWQQLRPILMILPEGDYGGPYPTLDGWLVFQIVRKEQRLTPLSQLPPEQQRLVSDRAHEAAREAALRQYTDALREQYKPVTHPEVLKTVPWPIPPLPGGTAPAGT